MYIDVNRYWTLTLLVGFCCMGAAFACEESKVGAKMTSIVLSGAGCPTEAQSVELSEDGKRAIVQLSQYRAEKSDSTNLSEAMKDCNLRIVMNVMTGFSVPEVSVKYAVNASGQGRVKSKLFAIGASAELAQETSVNHPNGLERVQVVHKAASQQLMPSTFCGGEVILGVNSVITADETPSFIEITDLLGKDGAIAIELGESQHCS